MLAILSRGGAVEGDRASSVGRTGCLGSYTTERAAHARAVATAKGRRVGRPSVVDPDKLAWAVHLRDVDELTIAQIAAKTGIIRTTLYRHLPPRPAEQVTAIPQPPAAKNR